MIERLLSQWAQARSYLALPPEQRRITFYSEGGGYWPHLRPLLQEVLRRTDVAYLCAGPGDPAFGLDHARLRRFIIGEKTVRTLLFRTMPPTVMVMTMPDLESLYPKRSVHPVHYVYVHHSIVSTHMIYRHAAFDHFDTVFCAGPHHVEEIRRREEMAGLPAKQLVRYGYPKLDEIRAAPGGAALRGHVLVAPSWGPQGLIEQGAEVLVASLLDAGLHVTLRPHPQTLRLAQGKWTQLLNLHGANPRFQTDTEMDSSRSLAEAEVMVSDWSGAALEFAFGLERPVLFLDGPRKVNNPHYHAFGLEPIEAAIRPRLGKLLAMDEIGTAGAAVRGLAAEAGRWAAAIRSERESWVFNPGRSAETGVEALMALVGQLPDYR